MNQIHLSDPSKWAPLQAPGFGTPVPAPAAAGPLLSPEQFKDRLQLSGPIASTPSLSYLLAKPVSLQVYPSYATPNQVVIRGRALEATSSVPTPQDSWWDNLKRSLHQLESDEIPDLPVEITFQGQRYGVTTDEEGFFELRLSPNPPLQPGNHVVQVQLADQTSGHWALPGLGQVMIHATQGRSVGVVSDIDDTILQTQVTSKRAMLKGIFFKNADTIQAVPGMAALYQALEWHLDKRIDGDIHYLSGSPVNLNERLDRFMAINGFPEGSLDLKHLGTGPNTDKLMAQDDYKLNKLRKLFQTYPERQFILIGDSGEKDPEIYRQIQQEFPAQVLGSLIHNVTGQAAADPRFAGQLLFDRTSQAAELAASKGWISAAGVQQVRQAEAAGN
ncbi:MAG TPA: phosphatase domain-containing protein [Candidatus Obscuribacterales bacterium]